MRLFPLDGSAWPRPRGRAWKDLQYVYQASSAANGATVTVGYPYSWLEWCAEPHSSRPLPLDVRRIPSQKTAGAGPADRCRRPLAARPRAVSLPAPVSRPRRGRPRKQGARFAFQDAATWEQPDEILEFEDPCYGQVRLERWNGLHERTAPAPVYDVVRASVHRERKNPLQAVSAGTPEPEANLRANCPPPREPKQRGKPPGWPKGKPRKPKERYRVVKKGVATAQAA